MLSRIFITALSIGSAMGVTQLFIPTAEERVECGASDVDPPSRGLHAQFLANQDDCKKIQDKMDDRDGYWKTYDWNDNRANEWVHLEVIGSCAFSIKHVDANSKANVMVGTADIEDYVKIARKPAKNGKVAQGGAFTCHDSRDNTRNEKLEWRVWNPNGATALPGAPGPQSTQGSAATSRGAGVVGFLAACGFAFWFLA